MLNRIRCITVRLPFAKSSINQSGILSAYADGINFVMEIEELIGPLSSGGVGDTLCRFSRIETEEFAGSLGLS